MYAIDILIKYWGYSNFRPKQKEIIEQAINNKDTLALLPTGGGKSICYQIPALMKEGVCLVISPLLSLMHDQIIFLKSKGIKSVIINSNMNYSEIETSLTNCIYGGVKFLYLSPEKLQNKLVKNRIPKMNINLITVDEAHCISEWGHSFRPSYRHISEIRTSIPNIPVLALTATATNNVIQDIQKNLLFSKQNVIKSSFSRKNISYVVDNTNDKKSKLIKLLNKIRSAAIIYVDTRKKAEELTLFLAQNKFSVNYYHAGLSHEIRKERQENWLKNQTRIIIATNAFGMGIDKADVKLVVHMDLPPTIETYYQQAGRAGRNGQTAYAFLLANQNDIKRQEKLLHLKHPKIKNITNGYQNITSYLQIAEGDLPKESIPFDIVSFSKRYKTSVLQTYYIIKYLEKEEKIRYSNNINSPSKLKISISKSELYKFQITNKSYDSFIKNLLRSYSNIFNDFVIIEEKNIAFKLKKSVSDIKKILRKLQQLEVLEYNEKNKFAQLTFLQNRQDLKNNHLNRRKWEERKNDEKEKLENIKTYVKNQISCRSQLILKYFSEDAYDKCGVCDICVKEKRKSIKEKTFKEIVNRIKELLNIKELTLDEICNSTPHFIKEDIIYTLNYLFDQDKILKFGKKYKWKG